jgi:hypothetical protein
MALLTTIRALRWSFLTPTSTRTGLQVSLRFTPTTRETSVPGFRPTERLPQTVFERWNAQRQALGLWVFDPTAIYQMRGVPDAEIGLTMDCPPVADRIVAGLREHKSQHHLIFDDPDDTDRRKRVVGRTWAVVAWPPRSATTSMLSDVFGGLP